MEGQGSGQGNELARGMNDHHGERKRCTSVFNLSKSEPGFPRAAVEVNLFPPVCNHPCLIDPLSHQVCRRFGVSLHDYLFGTNFSQHDPGHDGRKDGKAAERRVRSSSRKAVRCACGWPQHAQAVSEHLIFDPSAGISLSQGLRYIGSTWKRFVFWNILRLWLRDSIYRSPVDCSESSASFDPTCKSITHHFPRSWRHRVISFSISQIRCCLTLHS